MNIYVSDCTKISTCSVVMRFMLSKAMFWREFQISKENHHFKFILSQITNLSAARDSFVKNTSFLLQFAVLGKLPHLKSNLTTTINALAAFILAKIAFGGQCKEQSKTRQGNISPIVL